MRRWISALLVVLAACTSTTPSEPSLRDALGTIPDEVNESIAELRELLAARYETLAELYLQLSDLRLGPELAVLYDKAGRLDVPGSTEDLAAYERFVGEVLLAAEALDAAVAAQDLDGLSLAWLRIEVAAGTVATSVSGTACPLMVPEMTRDLCLDPAAAGYEAEAGTVINQFLGRYRPALRLPEAFGDVIRSGLVVQLAPEVRTVITTAAADLDALDLPNPYVGVHRAFSDHLTALHDVWVGVEDTGLTDPLLWEFLTVQLQEAVCEAIDPYEDGRGLLLPAVPDSTLVAVAEIWLLGPATGCLE